MRFLYRLFKFLPVAATLILCSCNPQIYKPYTRASPLFQEKGEAEANLQFSAAGTGISAAYAPLEHLALIANASISDTRDSGTYSGVHYNTPEKYNIFEIGGGYFSRIGNEGAFELLGGAGYGNREASSFYLDVNLFSNSYTTLYFLRSDMANFFIQPGIGYIGEKFEFGFSIKMNYINYSNFYYEKRDVNNGSNMDDSVTTRWGPNAYLEPAFYLAFGSHNVKVFTQIGFSIPVFGQNMIYGDISNAYSYISLGITVHLRNLYWK